MTKLTGKQESFARHFVECGDARKAYELAGYSQKMSLETQRVEACRLLKHPNVSLMVQQLKEEHAKRHEITIDTITEMLKQDRELARQLEQSSAAVSATMGLAKIHGLIVDKKLDVTGEHERKLKEMEERAGLMPPPSTQEHEQHETVQ